MADNDSYEDEEGAVAPKDAHARRHSDEVDQRGEGDDESPPARSQDYFASRGFQILVTVLFTILVLVLCVAVGLSVLAHEDAVTPVVTLFGVLITGVFVFMTLRIESGARKEAQAVAQTEARFQADLAARKAASTEARRVAEVEARTEAEKVARDIAREIAEREFERMRDYFARR